MAGRAVLDIVKGGGPATERVESIELVRLPFSRAVEQARAGTIDVAISALALLRAEAFLSQME